MAQTLQLEQVRLDGGTQPRKGISWEVVYEYTELMEGGTKFPPITVFYDGSNYWLADGFHRYHAAVAQEVVEIAADVIQGTIEDAQWFSFGANKAHGLMRSNEDKQRAVQAALRHPKCAGLSNRQIAKHVGVSEGAVRGWRDKLSAKDTQIDTPTRTATRNGTTYEINTSNIGKSRADTQPMQKEQPVAEAQPAPEPVRAERETPPASEQADSEDLRMFEYHLRGILQTQLTDRLLADEIIASPAATQILSLMERVNELLAAIQAHAAADCQR